MDKFFKIFFSMKMMTLGLFIFLAAIGTATFIESMYDTQTARIIIYNSLWFELVLAYLCVNLIANIFEHRMFRREKAAVLSFHLSFIIILIGAAVTRYYSFDGMMEIREGEKSNIVYSSDPYLWFKINDGKLQYTDNQKMFLSEITNNDFSIDVNFPNHKTPVTIEYVNFQRKMIDSLIINDSIEEKALDIITDGMKSNYVTENGFLMLGGNIALSFEKEDAMPGIHISEVNGQMMMKTKLPLRYLPMSEMQKARQSGQPVDEKLYVNVPVDTMVPFKTTTLYLIGDQQFVFKQVIDHAKMMKVHSGKDDVGYDYLSVKITDGKESKIVELGGGVGIGHPEHVTFEFAGLTYEMEYGSMAEEIPFYVACRDFQLDKYPGSEAASSFASEVTIVDDQKKYKRDQRIFMNNVMDYRGYRFFQSSYDLDNPSTPENEEGTKLSVNQDWWGTNITYLGYMFMMIGMVLSLFSGNSRFKELNQKLKKTKERRKALNQVSLMIILSFGSLGNIFAQDHQHTGQKIPFEIISKEHAENLESLLIQSYEGRIVPLHTCFDQLLRKIYRDNKYEELNAMQTIMSMHMYPQHWLDVKIIQVPSNLRVPLNLGDYASFKELTNEKTRDFKWLEEYNIAHKKPDSRKNEFDKKLIKLGEKYQVVQTIFMWQYMKIMPAKNAANNMWYVPLDPELMKLDSTNSSIAMDYIKEVFNAAKTNSYSKADILLKKLKKFQHIEGKKVVPSESKIDIEIKYNKMNIFSNSLKMYLLIGLLLLTLFFLRIFKESFKLSKLKEFKTWMFILLIPGYFIVFVIGFLISWLSEKGVRILSNTLVGVLFLVLLYHGLGISFRWYITGYAPWNNGYGAIIFIAWITIIAGFIFSKKNPSVLAGTAILAALMIFVTEMSLMDPEITPVVPVLKSYWLMIHVSIITASYGFLGLGCILSLINLILYITRDQKNGILVSVNISEITYVTEMIITLGLFMLTIGTFLGGIWANESWGRYWAWDPKEVWALVSVLVYAIILHLRYIPALSGKFLFNVVTFWGYTSISFTYFGVNYYLKGLHSYAQGDGLGTVPNDIKITIAIFFVLTLVAAVKNSNYKKQVNQANSNLEEAQDELA